MPLISALALAELHDDKRKNWYQRHGKELQRKGLVKVIHVNGQPVYTLTCAGKRAAQISRFSSLKVKKQGGWDGLVRVVIFDIEEVHRRVRGSLREKLRSLGFRAIQKSVFIQPFPAREEILCVKKFMNLRQQVLFFETSEPEMVRQCRKKFKYAL